MRRFLVVVALSVCLSAVADEKEPKDQERLQGLWQAVAMEQEGQKAPAEAIKSFRLLFKGNQVVFDPDRTRAEHTFELGTVAKLRTMNLTPAAGPGKGMNLAAAIYMLDGDKLTLCLDTATRPPVKRPTEFKTAAGDGRVLFTLERVKPAK